MFSTLSEDRLVGYWKRWYYDMQLKGNVPFQHRIKEVLMRSVEEWERRKHRKIIRPMTIDMLAKADRQFFLREQRLLVQHVKEQLERSIILWEAEGLYCIRDVRGKKAEQG